MKKYLISLLSAALIFSSCQNNSKEPDNRPIDSLEVEKAEAAKEKEPEAVEKVESSYPSSKEMTISKEGMQEKITANYYRSPKTFPLQFHTYVPNEIEIKAYDAGEGKTVQFSRDESANLMLVVLPGSIDTKEKAMLIARQRVEADGEVTADAQGYKLKNAKSHIIKTSVASRNGNYYYWYEKYPVEYADGFGPEIHFIKDKWVWK